LASSGSRTSARILSNLGISVSAGGFGSSPFFAYFNKTTNKMIAYINIKYKDLKNIKKGKWVEII
jgi:hypothetical protein